MVKMEIKNDKWLGYIQRLIFVIFCFVLFLIVAIILNGGLSFNSAFFLCFAIFVGFIFFLKRNKISNFLRNHKRLAILLCVIGLILGIIARLSLLSMSNGLYIDEPLSDTGVHWYGAGQLLENGSFNQETGDYEAIYPYLSSYTLTLTFFMRLFGQAQSAIVVSNLIFDIVSAIALFFLFSHWKRSRVKGLFAAALWMINPIEIAFVVLPLAIVVVNMFMVLSIVCTYFLFQKRNEKIVSIVLALILGIILSVANMFRPIFIIILIAVIIYRLLLLFREKKNVSNAIAGVVCICLTYFIFGMVSSPVHQSINSYYHGEKSSASWSIFVGANYETCGKWSSDDRDLFFGPILNESNNNIVEAQSKILRRGLGRYKEMLFKNQLINHMMNKIGVLFGDVENSIYDIPYAYNFDLDNDYYKFLQDAILVYYYALIIVCVYSVWTGKKKYLSGAELKFEMLLMVIFIGLFFASLMVEVMNRYSLPFIVIILIITLGLSMESRRNSRSMIK